jgi:glycosyltransferase involved in cell wall biosynthesis
VREYRKQAEDLGLQDIFLFTGFQPSAAGTLTELDAVIMPSRREACPLVAMEAMVLGCPLIASDCLGLRELTRGTPSLTSMAGDAPSLAAAIEQFIRHRDRLRADAAAFVATARRSFDSGVATGRLADIFDTALVSRGRRAAIA